jgi:protein-tyrosine-phosphatase
VTVDHEGFRKLLADDVRWHILEQLARSDRKVQELVASSGRPQNLVSYHLGKLRRAGLITQGRSAADARDVYCRLNLDRFTELYARAAGGVQPAFALAGPLITRLESFQPVQIETAVRPWRVLFICTGNSARSQMAEAFTRELSRGTLLALSRGPVEAESAGTAPRPVHPMAIRVMKDLGLSIEHQCSKSPDAVRDHQFDQVITVCDRAREACDPIPGVADPLHWSLPDPREAAGTQDQVYEVFRASALEIAARVRQLLVQVGARRMVDR